MRIAMNPGLIGCPLCSRQRPTIAVLATAATIFAVCMAGGSPAAGQADTQDRRMTVALDLEVLHGHATRTRLLPNVPDPADFGVEEITAFEENYKFLYLAGLTRRQVEAAGKGPLDSPASSQQILARRVFLLKPSILVVDDRLSMQPDDGLVWELHAPFQLASLGGEVADAAGGGRVRCRSLVPQKMDWTTHEGQAGRSVAAHQIAAPEHDVASEVRILHVMSFGGVEGATLPECSLEQEASTLALKMTVWDQLTDVDRVVQLVWPATDDSGTIKIFDRKGHIEVPTRLLPAGILPAGELGVELREQWDLPYQRKGLATWDTGRPSSELMRLVQSQTIKPCRTVELGCGTGNDAIYLAEQGFDVTAIDISAAALRIAQEKAVASGVQVRWLLADVLRPPKLEAFDFVYDRGCYHEVRRNYAQAYASATRSLTREGSQILILAGNANKDSYWRFHGPPRVKEEEIRTDFARGFRLHQLKEFRFDPVPPDREGALAWSILLERTSDSTSR